MTHKLLPLLLLSISLICLTEAGFSPSAASSHEFSSSSLSPAPTSPLTAHTQDSAIQSSQSRLLYLEGINIDPQTKTMITIVSVGIILVLILIKKCYSKHCRDGNNQAPKYEQQFNSIVTTATPNTKKTMQQNLPVDEIEFDIDLIKTKYLKSTCSSAKNSPGQLELKDNLQRSN